MDNPFFSVCIPATGRENTIFRALSSVAWQKFRNFEVVVTTRQDPDTDEEIQKFFNSSTYEKNTFNYTYKSLDIPQATPNDWNDPLQHASGKYIAMLEGDDLYNPRYLYEARKIISDSNIGIYFVQTNPRKHGLMRGEKFAKSLYRLDSCPPPSQTIFIRTNKKGKKYLFNETYNYCPELELWIDISRENKFVFHNDNTFVYRRPTSNNSFWYKRVTDKYKLVNHYRTRFGICSFFVGYFRILLKANAVYDNNTLSTRLSNKLRKFIFNNYRPYEVYFIRLLLKIHRSLWL